MKKKIAFILPSINGGGAEKVYINLAIYFSKLNYEVTLISIKNKNDYNLDFKQYKFNFIMLNKKKLLFSFVKLISFFKSNKFDVIFSNILHLNIMLFFLNKIIIRQKLIIRESNNIKLNIEHKNFFIKYIYNFLIPIVYNNSLLITPSRNLKYDLIKNYTINPKNIFVINNPISTQFNQNNKIKNFSQFLNYYKIIGDENTKIILSIGSLTKQKNQIQIINSFSKLKDITNLRLIILGEGPLKKNLIKVIKKNKLQDHIHLLGFHSEVELFLTYTSLYVCSSLWEGFPNALLDAASYNIPIISNNCDFGPSEILDNGKYGGLCDINNSNQMAELIHLGLNAKINPIPQNIVTSNYSLDVIGNKYEELLSV